MTHIPYLILVVNVVLCWMSFHKLLSLLANFINQFLNTENNMTFSKINEPVTITRYKSTEISFELSRAYRTSSLNVSAAIVLQLNHLCDAFNKLRYIHFLYMADGKIGALIGVNAFAFTYPTHAFQ